MLAHLVRGTAIALTLTLLNSPSLVARAGEKHPKGEKVHNATGNTSGKANANAARVANAAEHKAMVQQQVAIQRQNSPQNGIARHENNPRRLESENENRLGHRNGLGNEHRTGARTNANQHRNMETGPVVSSLHTVVGHLNQADHDYDGHRVQAIHHLGQALNTLQSGGAGNRVGTGAGAGINPGNRATNHAGQGKLNTSGGIGKGNGGKGNGSAGQRMSQAESDAHLRQAHQELTALESRISSGNSGTLAAHHQQAHNHIQQALQHLNSALATR